MTSKAKKVTIAEVVRTGSKLIVPEGLSFQAAIEVLERQRLAEESDVEIKEEITQAPFWDGILALKAAVEQLTGYAELRGAVQSVFGMEMGRDPGRSISVEVSPDEYIHVPWGTFALPNGGEIRMSSGMDSRRMPYLVIIARTKNKYADCIRELAALTRTLAVERSIYKGKSVRLSFGDNGAWNMPKHMRLFNVSRQQVVFSQEIEQALNDNIFTPLEHTQACRDENVPLKRGVLLAGPYGVGKTLLMNVLAQTATKHGWTVFYVEDVTRIAEVLPFAAKYAPAIVAGEDLDRVAGLSDTALTAIRNTLDSVESKTFEVMVVLTTNYVERVPPALLRPGRFDVVFNIQAPDAVAAARLIRLYADSRITDIEELEIIALKLAGHIPAVIREVVERAKLGAISRTHAAGSKLTSEDLMTAAYTVLGQAEFLRESLAGHTPTQPPLNAAMGLLVEEAVHTALQKADLA